MSKRGARRKKAMQNMHGSQLEQRKDVKHRAQSLLPSEPYVPAQPLYLYLTKREWATSWIEGGVVPLAMTSKYLAQERSGTLTPDEDVHRELTNAPYSALKGVFSDELLQTPGFRMSGVTVINRAQQTEHKNVNLSFSRRPALVLCLSIKKDAEILTRLGKEVCVEIKDINSLKASLDKQLKEVGVARKCEYTPDFDRNHFLKSIEDEWQQEYRIIWQGIQKETSVTISKGTGILLDI